MIRVRELFGFPDPVNETSARLVAAGVIAQAVAFLVWREGWMLIPLTYGFLARVLTGPTLSPLGQIATRVATPFVTDKFGLPPRMVPGPPKRFAQGIGLGFTVGASVAWLLGAPGAAFVLLGLLVVAAGLEAVLGICLGCIAFRFIWECEDCDDISDRLQWALTQQQTREGEPSASEAVATTR